MSFHHFLYIWGFFYHHPKKGNPALKAANGGKLSSKGVFVGFFWTSNLVSDGNCGDSFGTIWTQFQKY